VGLLSRIDGDLLKDVEPSFSSTAMLGGEYITRSLYHRGYCEKLSESNPSAVLSKQSNDGRLVG